MKNARIVLFYYNGTFYVMKLNEYVSIKQKMD